MSDTPDKPYTNKYLTPCRTYGLRRPKTTNTVLKTQENDDTKKLEDTPNQVNKLGKRRKDQETKDPKSKSIEKPEEPTYDDLLPIVARINEKYNKLKQSPQHSRKAKIDDLETSISKLIQVLKTVLDQLQVEMSKYGLEMTVLDILREHKIDPDVVDFDAELMEFKASKCL